MEAASAPLLRRVAPSTSYNPSMLVADAVSHAAVEPHESSLSVAHAAMRLVPQFATMTSTAKLLQLQSSLSLFVSGT